MIFPFLLTVAATIEVNPGDNLYMILQGLQAGDEVIVHAGTYPSPGYVALVLPGTADAPIVIRGADGEVAVLQGVPEQNLINVEGTYYTIKNLEFSGGSHGVRVGTSAHAVFEDLHIHDTNDVGISCNRPDNSYEDITIRRLHIRNTGLSGGPGECMYLGCNDGVCKVWDSLVEFNLCHDTTAGEQGDGIELKTGSYNTIIRHNVIYNVKYPGITAYGTQGMAPNVIEGNAVWNVVDNGIQLVGDAVVRNNLVFDVGASGIAAKPSQGELVKDLTVVHNTVIGAGDTCFRGNQLPGGGANIVVANNAFYCEATSAIKLPEGQGPAVFAGNAVLGAVSGVMGGTVDGQSLAAAFVNAAGKDVYPAEGSPLLDVGDAQWAAQDDFNCLPRAGSPEIGAYDHSQAGNPGWMVQPDFKQCAEGGTTTGTDTDTDTSGGSTGVLTTDPTASGTGVDPTSGGGVTSGGGGGSTEGGTGAGSTGGTAAGPGSDTATATDTAGGSEGEGCACRGGGAGSGGLLGLLALGLRRRRRA